MHVYAFFNSKSVTKFQQLSQCMKQIKSYTPTQRGFFLSKCFFGNYITRCGEQQSIRNVRHCLWTSKSLWTWALARAWY